MGFMVHATFRAMFSLYLFSAIVGGALIAFSLFGSGDGHGHDFGGGHAAGHDVGHDHNPFKFLSLRTLTYFLFVFGGVGAVLSRTWSGSGIMAFLLATVLGTGVGFQLPMPSTSPFTRKGSPMTAPLDDTRRR